MSNWTEVTVHNHRAFVWLIALTLLMFALSPAIAQNEVTVHQPVDGLFVRHSDIGQPPKQLGIVNPVAATWTAFQVPYSSRSRPLWSPDGQYIAYGLPSAHSAIVEVASGTITFTTEEITGTLTPFDINDPRGWSADGQSLAITYAQVGSLSSLVKLYDVDLITHTAQEIRQWQTDDQVTDMPLPPDATSVQLAGGARIERNPVFDDWFIMQFSGRGYYSTFDIGEPAGADINVLWNFSTDEYISLDALVPGMSITNTRGDWSHDGTHLLLQALNLASLEPYILMFHFTPEQGLTLMEQATVENRTPQHWLDAGSLFFSIIQDYQNGAAYVLGEIVNGEYRETPFFTLNGDPFRRESIGDWYMRADEVERHRLSCLFEWSLPARFGIRDRARVNFTDGTPLRLREAPGLDAAEVMQMAEGTEFEVIGGPACVNASDDHYRFWQIELDDSTIGWAAEAGMSNYFMEPVSDLPTVTPSPTATSTPTPATFPETEVLDDFNRADGDLGGDWSGTTGSYGIAGNQVAVTGDGDIYWNAQSFGADQEVFVTLAGINPNAEEIDLLLKRQGTGWQDGLLEVWYAPARGSVQVWTYLSGPEWVQHGGDIPVTFAAGDQFGARALADGTVEVYQNGIILGSVDITSWSHYASGGSIGLWMVDAAGTVLDDFGGGSLSGGPPPTSTSTPTATPDDPPVTAQVSSGSDDVNEDGDSYVEDYFAVWLGTGESVEASYTGLRFTNLTIPQGATILSAHLEVYTPMTQWISLDFRIAAEAADDSVSFSDASRPSQRTLTNAQVQHSSNVPWLAEQWQALDEMAAVVQEVVDRPGWQSGNSLSLILQGTGTQWGRKAVPSYEHDPAYAPRLVVTYTTQSSEPTATPAATDTPVPGSSVLDDFNRSDGAVGANWSGDTGSYSIVSNQLAASGPDTVILWNASAFGADQEAAVTIVDLSGDSTFGLMLKAQSASDWLTGAVGVSYLTGSEGVTVWSYAPGQGVVQHGQSIPVTLVDGDRLRVYARADGMVEVYRNDSLVGTRDVSNWPYANSGGYIGLSTTTGSPMLDDFDGRSFND